MRHQKTELLIDYEKYGLEPPVKNASVTSYVLDIAEESCQPKRPAVVICPGGGYQFVSPREGEPVALKFNSYGFHAFVLDYSTEPVRFPASLLELSKAVAYVRAFADEFHVDETKVVVCGFSAGAHLAASLGVYWKEGFIQRLFGYDNDENRPDGLVLCYPVISSKEGLVHTGSVASLFGKYPDERELALFSLEDHVSETTPPTFLWHTAGDPCVPAGNSLAFAKALAEHEIPYELHIFPRGDHGLSLGTSSTANHLGNIIPEIQCWPDMVARFIESL